MKGATGKIALGFAILAVLCTAYAAEPSLTITGKMTSGQSEPAFSESWMPREGFDSPDMPQTQSDQSRTFRISIKNNGARKVFFTKLEVSFSAERNSLLSSANAKKGFLYADTRFAGETIESKGFFNTSFTLNGGDLDYFISNNPMDNMRQGQVRLDLNLFNEDQMIGSGWTSSIPLESSGIGSLTNKKLPASDTFSFAPSE